VGWDLHDLLRCGFQGVAGKTESSPARHFRTALGQIVNFFYTLQGEAAGAQAFSNVDTLLAPFIRYDGLDEREVRQALQEFVFNVNIPTRVGFQTPFTNITLDLKAPATLADQPVVIGGQLMDRAYREFEPEMRTFNRAFLDVMAEGDARNRVFTFPIPTYNITADFDWDAPELETLWQVTAKYGIPNFANFINSDMSPADARSMCCRLRLDLRHLEKRGGGLFGANPLTGSIGVVTINMPRLGHISADESEFVTRLDRLMDLARSSLEIKRKLLERLTDRNLYPYTRFYLRSVKEHYGQYWHNHFSTIGLVGMNEASRNLLGKDIGTAEGRGFAARILDHMRARLLTFQEQTGNLYNLEATPAEGTSYRLARLDRQKYPNITSANTSPQASRSEPFYTNSTQLPVNYTNDIWEVLELQDDLQARYTGGTGLHINLGEAVANPNAVKRFVRKVCTNYRLPYFTISPVFSICAEHGYLRGQVQQCPHCGRKTEVYARVVGYLRPVDQWNEGKQAEFEQRRYFQIKATS
ncbi:MAG TPA: ribonucleoside triphosphate reductase, partial [Sedimentisphaerales bacterium]|nr:ribonucleoside triphosphate reductase [Sedimentisphaerales bacterium]